MYVRDAKNRDEPWLLDQIEALGVDAESFRSRDYVLAVDEESNTRVGFGRRRIHSGEPDVCELTGIGVVPTWRDQGVGGHVIMTTRRKPATLGAGGSRQQGHKLRSIAG